MNKSPDTNIDQLDALLEDLKHERQITKDKGNERTKISHQPQFTFTNFPF